MLFFDWYSGDTGPNILKMIFNSDSDEVPPLHIYPPETASYEWAYCIDLDAGVVEVYRSEAEPAAIIPFADFTVFAMRALEAGIKAPPSRSLFESLWK